MNTIFTSGGIAWRLWALTNFVLATGGMLFIFLTTLRFESIFSFVIILVGGSIVSLPALIILFTLLSIIKLMHRDWRIRLLYLLFVLIAVPFFYGLIAAVLGLQIIPDNNYFNSFFSQLLGVSAVLSGAAVIAAFFSMQRIISFFSNNQICSPSYRYIFSLFFLKTNTTITMEQSSMQVPAPAQSNRLLIKGLITGGLILLMLIPTVFIQNLVEEREERQKEIVKEVSSKWASAQTLSGPFLSVPYTEVTTDADGKILSTVKQLIITADHLSVTGRIIPEERSRSIYKVLLYRTALNFSGTFKPQWPADINPTNADLAHARLCFALSDFKGIEEQISARLNQQKFSLSPGLPVKDFGETGLSVPVDLSTANISEGIPFETEVKLKGSGQLHFIPTGANSKYILASAWANPSFDGSVLPTARTVMDSGFNAQWNFNRANLPFGSVMKAGTLKISNMAFGVSLVQPADQYNKTMRSAKYAILIIGLSFALFFIIEIMQKKPFHPVQYVLVGLALVIFYSLLLSISEFLLFDKAYFIAASATVLLIMLYAKSHFNSWGPSGVLGTALSALYGFVFILIRLEDTALLVGSIGLFMILALVMYASRKIDWYGEKAVGIKGIRVQQ
ncbi:MAG: cell envelope integrity protein CreD [Ferruginibacter sp.]